MDTKKGSASTTATATISRSSDPADISLAELVTPRNPFTTPYGSLPPSAVGSTSGLAKIPQKRYFQSRRIKKGDVQQPWLDKKDPREKWVTIIPIIGLLVGVAIAAILIYDGLQTVSRHVYCPVLDEDFSQGLRSSVWTKEVQVGGFGYAGQRLPAISTL